MTQPVLPSDVIAYSTTPDFTQDTVPDKLLSRHNTKPGVWGKLKILDGDLVYVIDDLGDLRLPLQAGETGVIVPQQYHHLELTGPVRFRVTFLKAHTSVEAGPHD